MTFSFDIPAWWTPEQALAVYELLDDLRDAILNHYNVRLIELLREKYAPEHAHLDCDDDDDLPF